MATQNVIAELLVEIGLDSKDAEKSAKQIKGQLDKVKKSAKGAADEADEAGKALKRMGKGADVAKKFSNGLLAVLGSVTAVTAGLGKVVISTGKEFESLRVQLITATGSAEGAEKALTFIKDFAKNTPFQVGEITEAFVKLTNLGLDPSERALTAFGDTASAMGKSLDQFIEAVADATTGEFERLKEFGIKSKSEGDRVSFTFRGITTEVGKNSLEIEEFLTSLGENNFGGAMARQMDTLGGIISNLQDAFTEFILGVAEMGPLEEFKLLVTDLRDATGDKEGLAKVLAKTLVSAIRAVRRVLRGDLVDTLKKAAEALKFLVDNFENLVALFAGAKTFQAFNAVASGFSQMGIAAAGALGPIGAIAAAMIALIPIAIDVGKKIGDVITADVGRRVKRGAPKTFTQRFGMGTKEVAIAQAQQKIIDRESALLEKAGLEGRSDFATREARSRLDAAVAKQNEAAKSFAAREAGKAAAQEARDAEVFQEQRAEKIEFGQLDQDIASISEALGIEGEPTAKQQRALNEAQLALAEGKSLKEAKKAAGIGRKKGRKKKAKKKVVSPTTVSEFFGAAARGELGAIAARTPSTGEIEPTVAIDITNNNFSFNDVFNIKGTADPQKTATEVVVQVKKEFDRRLGSAGQQMATNVVR